MKKFHFSTTFFIAILLIFVFIPKDADANTNKDLFEDSEQEQINGKYVIDSDGINAEIPLYLHESENSEVIAKIPIGSYVIVTETGENFSQVHFIDSDTKEEFIGFIKNNNLEEISLDEESKQEENLEEEPQSDQNIIHDNNKHSEKIQEDDFHKKSSTVEEETADAVEEEAANNIISEKNEKNIYNTITSLSNKPTLTGAVIKQITNVYSEPSTKANILKSYELGAILKYKTFSDSWYICTIYIEGKSVTGYIRADDVETSEQNQKNLRGIALKKQTHVYSKASTISNVLKSYSEGSILSYKSFTSNWYEATVYINGKTQKGYLHKNDVETSESDQNNLRGIALNNPTNVYTKASTNSSVLKSYTEGSILSYKSFTENWYEATVYINGKSQIGYIYKNDIDSASTSQKSEEGIAYNNPTNVYTTASKNSKVLKSYPIGKVLKYKTFTNEWYEATVYINDKPVTGYIHVNDVGKVENSPTYKGIAIKTTNIYEKTDTSSKILKSYPQGKILKYKLFNLNWYIATVYINGVAKTGYIYANDVETAFLEQTQVRGIGKLNPTPVYELANTDSKVLKTYDQGSIMSYKTFSPNWYQATIFINGKGKTGYIHKNDVENSVSDQKTMIGVVTSKNGGIVYSKASTLSKVIKSYPTYSVLRFKTFTSDWYEAVVTINGKQKTGYIHKNDVNIGIYNKVIVLDAGHGGYDGGASGNGIIEKQLNLDVTLALKEKLENAGAIVHLTRSSDVYISLDERAALSKKVGADIFVSIHANSATPSAHGAETYYSGQPYNGETNPFPTESMLLATYIQNHLVSETNMYDRNAKHGGYIVLRRNSVPSALVELGFITNASDAAKMKQSNYKYQAAEGIYKGILEYFK